MAALTWDEVAARFAAAPSWWVATTGPDGPHAVPVWGVHVVGLLAFYGDPSSVRSRNLAADPRVVVHLESADDVLILHGSARDVGTPQEHPKACAAYAEKYSDPSDLQYLPDAAGMEGTRLWAITPQRAIAWRLDGGEGLENRRWRAGE